jgi:thioesterase domain-containing protein/acyl carrier protein
MTSEMQPVDENSRSMIVAPRNDIELRLLEIWTQVLERSSFGVTDNFYDLGGDSLKAVYMIAEVESEFCVALSPAEINDAATVEKMAGILGRSVSAVQPQEPEDHGIVELQKGTSRRALFCFPGNSGAVFSFYPLSEKLGPDRGVFVVSYAYLGRRILRPSMEGLAAACLEGIKKVQSAGPYHLAGYCFGASVAYEVAQQLRAAGEEVALLALLDPELGTPPGPLWKDAVEKARQFASWLRSIFTGPRKAESPVQDRGRLMQARIARYQARALSVHQRYQHLPSQSRLSVIYATQGSESGDFPFWQQRAAGGIEDFSVPGTHFTMLQEPNVRRLAEILQSRFTDS